MLARINWKPSRGEIRYFSITLAIVAVIMAAILLATGKMGASAWVASIGLVLAALCATLMPIGRVVYLFWMSVTFILSLVVSPIVISIIFYLVLTPIAIVSRLSGKDELRLKKPRDSASYFTESELDTTPESFRRQF